MVESDGFSSAVPTHLATDLEANLLLDTLSFELRTAESVGGGAPPSFVSYDPISKLVSWNPTVNEHSGLWELALIVRDDNFCGGPEPYLYEELTFELEIYALNHPPVYTAVTPDVVLENGDVASYRILFTDEDIADTITPTLRVDGELPPNHPDFLSVVLTGEYIEINILLEEFNTD